MTSARKAATREAIIDSALLLFAARGYDSVRIGDVTRAAGVSRATFYNHFSERAEILAALFERLLVVEEDSPARDARTDVPPLDQIVVVATEAARSMMQRPELARLLYGLPVRHETLLKPDAAGTPAVFVTIHRLLERAAGGGELRDDVPLDLICIHVHNALEAGMRSWAEGSTTDPVARVRALVELALYGAVPKQHATTSAASMNRYTQPDPRGPA